ncbi:RICIN domain-containing protein [Streptomyces luteireticuli]|uniref:Ricin B lectin domain-containing protein n=1 Tax=Streptomyces luteireticuli TaxID=173858 RepID=A0ABN0Z3Z1_9ACTN
MRGLAKLAVFAAVPAAALALMGTAGSAAAAAGAQAGAYYVKNTETKKCLEIENSRFANGARAQQWDCKGQAGAKWERTWEKGGYFELRPAKAPKMCLEVADSSKSNGARVQLWTCTGKHDTQLWSWDNNRLKNKNSGKVLEVEKGDVRNGVPIRQWDYSGHLYQAWGTLSAD